MSIGDAIQVTVAVCFLAPVVSIALIVCVALFIGGLLFAAWEGRR